MTDPPCKHPMVRVVSRHDDAEFVECQTCGEVFDSAEYLDMELEALGELNGDAAPPGRQQPAGFRGKGRKQGGARHA